MASFHYVVLALIPIFLFQLWPLSLASLDDQIPGKYFVNCGSKSGVEDGETSYVRDSFAVGRSRTVRDKNRGTNTSVLYRSARVTDSHRHPFGYEFEITENGTHFVRLHFFAFLSGRTDLADAVFSVGTSTNSLLLSKFAVRNSTTNTTSSPVIIKEFLLRLGASNDKFRIYFMPEGTSFAFVNAIEVFFVPNLTRDGATRVTSEGKNVTFSGLTSRVLRTVYRISFGGTARRNDTLSRTWEPDDAYAEAKSLARNCKGPSSGKLDYGILLEGNKNVAPEFVYRNCKKLEESGGIVANATWRFDVSASTRMLIRAHFCDTIGLSANVVNSFSFHIDRKFASEINPYEDNYDVTQVPFYCDFVVDSDSSGSLILGIGTREESPVKKAFLNGVEIMEFVKEWNLDPPRLDVPKDHRPVLVGSVCGLFSVMCAAVFLVFRRKKAKRVGSVDPSTRSGGRFFGFGMSGKASSVSSLASCSLKLRMELSEILYATRGFDAELLIGKGGFGKVYVGTLRNGLKVAVKRSDPRHGQGLPEFQTEITILSKIRHRNLVSLIGYCDEGAEMILVYEFMEKGTLQDHLYEKGNSESPSTACPKLTWSQRLEICIGAASGLNYLHTGPNGGIFHRDVKSTNILLDQQLAAKVADFGLSKSGPLDPDQFSIGIKGSFGYMDPEYLTTLQFTDKSDVYAFGVVLLEVLCGRPAIVKSEAIEEVNLAEWGMLWHKKGELRKVVDPSLAAEISPTSLRKFGEVVEKCLRRNSAERPAMLDVLWDLEYARHLQKAATPRPQHEFSATDTFSDLPQVGNLPLHRVVPDEGDELALVGDSSTFVRS